jgi:hypothetical protein
VSAETPPTGHADAVFADATDEPGGLLPAESDDARDVEHDAEGTDDSDLADVTAQVEQPAKVMRIGTMIKQLLEEVRSAPLDDAGRRRLREIHESSIRELEDGLAPELREELDRLTIPFGGETPSEAELRVAQAQLVGWLEGLFHGIQTAIYAQQAAARAQLEELRRRALPPGAHDEGRPVIVGPNGQMIIPPGARMPQPGGEDERGTGQYL